MHGFGSVLALVLAASAAAAQVPTPAVLGVEAGRPAEPMVEPPPRARDAEPPSPPVPVAVPRPVSAPVPAAGVGPGISGAIRVVLSSIGTVLDPPSFTGFGDGWESGHRWVPRRGVDGPRILGEPASDEAAGESAPLAYGSIGIEIDTGIEIRAPTEPGVWHLESGTGERLTVITQTPAAHSRAGRLNGYYIGVYPTAGSSREDMYAPPTAFIEVTPENRDLNVSEHLTLAQFLTKDQFDVWPKYLALDLRLVDKLELVIQELRAMGVRADRIHVMSGFRTPQYNGPGGGGRAALSRHMWGDAADVWIDNDGDGQMDDLNGDGRIDMDDAAVILKAVDRVERRYPELIGGAGVYPNAPGRGPYIHIDARGYHSRW